MVYFKLDCCFSFCRRLPVAVDDVQKGFGTGFDAIGRDAAAAVYLAVVLDLHRHLALSVLAERHAVRGNAVKVGLRTT
jgi:hypothetical protein